MSIPTGTSPELASPAATNRSLEDQDLLERSTKKTKRRRELPVSIASQPGTETVAETPMGDELMSPDKWTMPAVTPSNAWHRKEVTPQTDLEIVSDDDEMDEDGFVSEHPIIRVTKEEKERLRRPWRRSLIIKILGRTVSYPYLLQRLRKMWRSEAHFDLIALSHDYYIAKFESLRDYEYAKYEGPWMIMDHYVVVQEWQPNFSPRKNKTRKVLVWVRFPDIPIEYFDDEFLKKIGKTVGRPVKIDTATSLASKGKFARICLEIDISKPLESKFVLNFEEWPIEYEGIHSICFSCGRYGHRTEQCSPEIQAENEPGEGNALPEKRQINNQVPKEKYGTWMLVTRKARRYPKRDNTSGAGVQRGRYQSSPKPNQAADNSIGVQSSFASLDGLEDTGMEHDQREQGRSPTAQQTGPTLPRIRTRRNKTPDQNEQRGVANEMPNNGTQRDIPRQPVAATRGGFRGQSSQRPMPNRAAAEDSHTVVRGSNKGKNITTTQVHHTEDHPESSYMAGLEKAYMDDPPDTAHTNRNVDLDEPPDVALQEQEDFMNQDGDVGAASSSFKRTLRQFCRDSNPSLICLLEPKVSGNQANKLCNSFGFDEWIRVEAVGFSGGIWILWKNYISIEIIRTNPQYISVQVNDCEMGPWVLSLVYGSPCQSLKRKMFAELSHQNLDPQPSWLAVGDFNAVTGHEEVSNPASFSSTRCSDFNDWIFRQGLIDLGYEGSKYTWKRGTNTETFKGARLDRALGNLDWKIKFPDAAVVHLPMLCSDHCLLLVNTRKTRTIPASRSFRFNMAWTTHATFHALVYGTWSTNDELKPNLKRMAEALKDWNISTFGNIFHRKKRLLARLNGIQQCMTVQPRRDLLKLETKLRHEFEETLYQEELLWFQRSKEEWIVSGDRNTRFYHAATSAKNKHDRIKVLKDENGHILTDESEIREHVQRYFMALFSKEPNACSQPLLQGAFPRLSTTDWAEINKPFGANEVKEALFEMAPCKSPGPDGYTAGFYQKAWSLVGDSLIKFTEEFFRDGKLFQGCNDTFISLIPKVGNPESIKQFRPIGLCNVAYKLITKMMAVRLRTILSKLIGPFQASFVPGKQITDNILVYQEALNSMKTKKGKVGWMVMKIDLEKAYDRLSWSTIEDTLVEIGFNQTWTRNIMHCISSPRMAILWNGQQTDWFHSGRGIRQGDPLSPLLFVLCIERFSHIILNSVRQGRWKGIKISRLGPYVSHLLFADDMTLFGEATVEQAVEMKRCIDLFCMSSGQRVNYHKSSVFFSKNTNEEVQKRIVDTLGIPKVTNLGKYLGVQSIHGRLKQDSFEGIIDRIRSKLTGWKAKSLSLAGRHVLAQSVLSTVPFYAMQTTLLPNGVISAIEKLIRSFIWGGDSDGRKAHLVNWDTVTKSKAHGGLGIKRLEKMNHSFMAKLGWRILQGEDSLWIRIFKAKYHLSDVDCRLWQARSNMSNAMKEILKAIPILEKGIKRHVRNGRNTLFWTQEWLEEAPLLEHATRTIPSSDQDRLVASYWKADLGWQWDELTQFLPAETLNKLALYLIHEEEESNDNVCWKMEDSGGFSVASAYDIATGMLEPVEAAKWKLKVPNRIRTFLWLVKHGRIMCNSNRARRRLTDCDKCDLCNTKTEDIEHVLRRCPAAEEVWKSISRLDYERMKEAPFQEWLEDGLSDKRKGREPASKSTLFSTTLWWIWKWRNERVFNGSSRPLQYKISWIKMQAKETTTAFDRALGRVTADESSIWKMLSWSKPKEDFVKINIDGSVDLLTNRASCGGIIRDNSGSWKKGFMFNMGNCTPFEAESWALLKGIQLAIQMGVKKAMFESDSSLLVNYMTDSRQPTTAAHNILEGCKKELQRLEAWEVTNISREQNQAADKLAKLARNFPKGVHILDDPPVAIMGIVEDDIMGLPSWRHVCNTV
ncbi:PREDICTED: uncharacterized protein LOC109192823 [Ipomoea nil]|uniref:uncharacterized protein LOC109192823 n=1 Tax=Ipomoea nil TaxID=35883 RepID=UPI000900FF1B|nr:PREDICTED: uncharacterized protein LOC109192823 [Ipomoea nil]